MNTRRLFREYAKSKGKEAVEFVELQPDFYNFDVLVTKDSNGNLETMSLNYREVVFWIQKTYLKHIKLEG